MNIYFYFELKKRIFARRMNDYGINPWLGVLILIIVFLLFSFLLFQNTKINAAYIYGVIPFVFLLKTNNENALRLSCFDWEYIDSNSEDVNNHISKILYRYAYANNNEAIVSAQPYSDNFKYLVGYLFIFANSSSTQPEVDINDLNIYGTVDNNDSILFNNGTNFSAKNVVINQKWSK